MAVDATGSSRKCSRLHAIVAITGKNGESAIERDAPRLPALSTRSRFFFGDIVERVTDKGIVQFDELLLQVRFLYFECK